jgi:O-antigen ligase
LTIAAIGDAPWTGHGLGTFISAFKPYRDLSLPGLEIVNMAHNSYLELAMDVGVVAAGLFYLSLGLLVAACLRGIAVRRRDVIHPILAIAAGTQLFVVSFVDFAGQIPGIAIPFAYLLGVGCAQSFPGRSFMPEKA